MKNKKIIYWSIVVALAGFLFEYDQEKLTHE